MERVVGRRGLWLGLVVVSVALLLAMTSPARTGAGGSHAGLGEGDGLLFALAGGRYLQMDFLWVDGTGAPAGAIASLQETVLGANPGATVVHAPGASGWVEAGYRWPARPVRWQYNSAGHPAGMAGDAGAVAAAAESWNAAGSAFRFDYAGETDANTGACRGGGDGHDTVGWAPLEGTLLAVTCSLWSQDASGRRTATEFDMQLDPEWDWTAGGPTKVDLQSVAAHEFGHALGLAHSPNPAALMFADYTIGTIKRQPLDEDVAGLFAMYGMPEAQPPVRSVKVRTGANLLTWPGDNTSLDAAAGAAEIDGVYSYDAASGRWRHYFRHGPSYLNTLDILARGQPYWFLARGDGELVVP